MIQAEFIRDMHNNYLILTGIDENLTGYHIKMLLNNTIPGLLNVELRCIDHMNLFYYDITTLKSITSVYDNKIINYEEMKAILKNVLSTLEKIGEYLLSENDCIVYPEYIYVNPITHKVFLCHLIGFQENVQEQLSNFMEYLMNKVDYKDESAVLLIYAMYKMSREPNCTFYMLIEELNRNLNETSNHTTSKSARIKKERSELIENNNTKTDTKNRDLKYSDTKDKDIIKDKDNYRHIKKNVRRKNDLKITPFINQINSVRNSLLTQFGLKDNSSRIKAKEGNNITNCDKKTGVIPEEIENEYETIYYSVKTYSMAVLSILAGIGFAIGAIQIKMVHNSFGTRIDIVKLVCCFIIITMAEVLIMSKLFDEKNQLTRMEMMIEYIDPNTKVFNEETEQKDVFGGLLLEEPLSKIDISGENIVDETTILWSKADGNRLEPTRVLAELNQKKFYFEIKNTTAGAMEEVLNVRTPEKKNTEEGRNIKKQTRFYIVEFPFVIGKKVDSVHMLIDDPSVSRKHAIISRDGEGLLITDVKSTNGTYVNGRRIEANLPCPLSINDEVTIAKYIFVLKRNI